MITHAKRNILELTVFLHAPSAAWRIEVEVLEDGKRVALSEDQTAVATGRLSVTIPYAKLWSPDHPHLYDVQIRLYDGDRLLDEVGSYVGMRGI
jgi:beta-galactosidase/beta-glucuronidase